MWRRKWVGNRAESALGRADRPTRSFCCDSRFWQPYSERPPYSCWLIQAPLRTVRMGRGGVGFLGVRLLELSALSKIAFGAFVEISLLLKLEPHVGQTNFPHLCTLS